MDDSRLQPLDISESETIEGQRENIDELIIRLTKQVKGVGSATAGAIAGDFDGDLQAFLKTSAERIAGIKKSNGSPYLSSEQISEILKILKDFPKDLTIEESWVFYLGRQFLLEQIKMVEALTLDNFDINPLLAKALGLDTPRKVIAFNVYQTVTRSVVTSWGNYVEEIAKRVGCKDNDFTIEGKTGTNFDLVKTLNGVDYYIQVKSGPNTMNVGMVTSLNEAIETVESSRKNAKGILGMTYGTRSRISAQIVSNLQDSGAEHKMKVGREFWDFISEKTDFHIKLFELLEASSNRILTDSFIELIEGKINMLDDNWKKQSGGDLNEMLENYI